MPKPSKGPRLASSPAHERLITFAKRGDLSARRRVMRVIRDKSVVHILFTQIAEQMQQREGGYTRITKIAPRRGDNSPQAVIELVTEPLSAKKAVVKEAESAAKVAAKDDNAEVAAATDAAVAEGAAKDAVDQAVEANESDQDVAQADKAAEDLEQTADKADQTEAQAEEDADVAEDAEKAAE